MIWAFAKTNNKWTNKKIEIGAWETYKEDKDDEHDLKDISGKKYKGSWFTNWNGSKSK